MDLESINRTTEPWVRKNLSTPRRIANAYNSLKISSMLNFCRWGTALTPLAVLNVGEKKYPLVRIVLGQLIAPAPRRHAGEIRQSIAVFAV
jgi:hypothetical protein